MAAPSVTAGRPSSSIRRPLPCSAADKIAEGERLREEGLELLKDDEEKKAAVKFKTCFAYTKGLLPQSSGLAQYAVLTGQQTVIDADQQVAVRALELSCNEALAKIYFRRGGSEDHVRALAYSQKVLISDPDNVKGLFRAGQLHVRLKNIEDAKRCLTKAAKREPHNVAIRSELRNLTKLAQERGVDAGVGRGVTSEAHTSSAGISCRSQPTLVARGGDAADDTAGTGRGKSCAESPCVSTRRRDEKNRPPT